MLCGGRAIGAIVGIISACSLFVLLVACCIVYFRRYLQRKEINARPNIPQVRTTNQTTVNIPSESPPPYDEAMRDSHLFRWFYILFIISFLFSSCTDGKGFGGGRGGGGRGGGSRGGGSWGGSKGSGTFGGPSSYNRVNSYGSYNSMSKGRSGSSFKSNAMSFGAGALGGIAAYSLMRSMSSSYHSRPGYYEPGYGTGETCTNNEDLNGTRFGRFRCPLNGFPIEAKYCCGEYEKQYCCIRDDNSGAFRGASSFGWILLIIIMIAIAIVLISRHRRQKQKAVVMVPMEPTIDEQQGTPFYHPPPPPMGYPPPPTGNPYAPQNYDGNFNSFPQQYQTPYPPQQQMPYLPPQQMPYPPQQQMQYQSQQQQSYNPYSVKEGGPPAYEVAIHNNQGVSSIKPT
ncbi:unnamed protein product [Rotaria sp. Silwood1]|nr:unnamed protein product [Rotaria sp. Silwood1]